MYFTTNKAQTPPHTNSHFSFANCPQAEIRTAIAREMTESLSRQMRHTARTMVTVITQGLQKGK